MSKQDNSSKRQPVRGSNEEDNSRRGGGRPLGAPSRTGTHDTQADLHERLRTFGPPDLPGLCAGGHLWSRRRASRPSPAAAGGPGASADMQRCGAGTESIVRRQRRDHRTTRQHTPATARGVMQRCGARSESIVRRQRRDHRTTRQHTPATARGVMQRCGARSESIVRRQRRDHRTTGPMNEAIVVPAVLAAGTTCARMGARRERKLIGVTGSLGSSTAPTAQGVAKSSPAEPDAR
jgi:hypothetical protein